MSRLVHSCSFGDVPDRPLASSPVARAGLDGRAQPKKRWADPARGGLFRSRDPTCEVFFTPHANSYSDRRPQQDTNRKDMSAPDIEDLIAKALSTVVPTHKDDNTTHEEALAMFNAFLEHDEQDEQDIAREQTALRELNKERSMSSSRGIRKPSPRRSRSPSPLRSDEGSVNIYSKENRSSSPRPSSLRSSSPRGSRSPMRAAVSAAASVTKNTAINALSRSKSFSRGKSQ